MISNNDKIVIEKFLKEQGFDFNEYDEFIAYIQSRGMLNENVSKLHKIYFTKANLKGLYKEYINPIRRISKQLKLTYKELGERTGYTEGAFKNAISKDKVSEPMKKALFLLLEIDKLNNVISENDKKIESYKTLLKDALNG